MTNEETIKALKELQLGCFIGSVPYLALEKAIEALEMNADVDFDKVREQFREVENDQIN